ncbi:MAG: Desulfoferrodoxin Dfx domain protein [Ilumatobacteraceae bacterium]|nr:Desulfoferrodoxin Dfx domain protein [Ilumatobacteraceae bacterium]
MRHVWHGDHRRQGAHRLAQLLRCSTRTRDGPLMATQIGKRYTCEECEAQYLVVKGGTGTPECHGRPIVQQAPKPLPSSD